MMNTAGASGRFAAITLPRALTPRPGPEALTVAECRRLDTAVIDGLGLPGVVLMENAATGLAHVALSMLDELGAPGVLIIAGPGNNGGDGFALHRRLLVPGVPTTTVILFDRAKTGGDAAINLAALERLGGAIVDAGPDPTSALDAAWSSGGSAGLIVDAIFGVGLSRPPEGAAADAVAWINRTRDADPDRTAVLAVDLPTGLDGDTGRPVAGADPGRVVRADVTVTVGAMKTGLCRPAADVFRGRILVAGIGAP